MKKFVYSLFISGAVLAVASCASDEPIRQGENDGNVSFQVTLPGQPGTRFADGKSVDNLYYTVFDGDGQYVLDGTQGWPEGQLSTTVTIQLVANESYKVVFFADNAAADAYVYTPASAELEVDYSKMIANSDIYDAFYASENVTADGDAKEVILRRPFAQINIGTDDLNNASVVALGLDKFSSTLTINSGLSSGLNLLSGVSKAQTEPVEFDLTGFATLPTDAFPVEGYDYLEMNYLLVPVAADDQNNLIDAVYTVEANGKNVNTLNLSATPTRQNYRTNIYGSLLTTQNNFRLTIDPAFEGSLNPGPWDGKTVTRPVVDETAKTVTVSSPSDFAGFIEMVNGTGGESANNFEGYTVNLTQDIDFGGHVLTPIADGATRSGNVASGKAFKGVIDGGDNTIKNFIISNTGTDDKLICGFVTNLNGAGAALKNIKFENVEITSSVAAQTGIVGVVSNGATVENVHVLSGTITGTEATGGIAGRVIANGTITGCSNAASIHAKKYNAGGIVGAAYYTEKDQSMRIENCNNTGSVVSDGVAAGGIAGLSCAFISQCTNEGEIVCKQNSAGGIAGTQQDAGGITDCVNRGNVKCTGATLGAGGIVGWVRYPGSTIAYPNKNVIEVTGCQNYGNVACEGGYGVGGIVGLWYNMGKVSGCSNEAASISGSSMIAGIVGGSQFVEATPGLEVEKMLYITDNVSTTTLDQMTGSLKALIAYINSPENVRLSGNTPSQE